MRTREAVKRKSLLLDGLELWILWRAWKAVENRRYSTAGKPSPRARSIAEIE